VLVLAGLCCHGHARALELLLHAEVPSLQGDWYPDGKAQPSCWGREAKKSSTKPCA
jgi:hypothetical protein